MKQKCSFILKASTALVLALLMLFGTVTTSLAAVVDNAATGADADIAASGAVNWYDYSGNNHHYIYYDDSTANISAGGTKNVYAMMGYSGGSNVFEMSRVSTNTLLYRLDYNNKWTGCAGFGVKGASSAPSGEVTTADRYTTSGDFNGNATVFAYGSKTGTTLTANAWTANNGDEKAYVKNNVTLATKVAGVGSSSYTVSNTTIATLGLSSVYWNNDGTVSSKGAATGFDNGSVTYNNAVGAGAIDFSYSDLDSAYAFKGWYDSNGNKLSDSATYSGYQQGHVTNITYYAYFQKQKQTLSAPEITIGGQSNAVNVASGSSTTVTITNFASKFSDAATTAIYTLKLYKEGSSTAIKTMTTASTTFTPDASAKYYVKCEPTSGYTSSWSESTSNKVDVTLTKNTTIYIKKTINSTGGFRYAHLYNPDNSDANISDTGNWPGDDFTTWTETTDGKYYYKTYTWATDHFKIILNNNNGSQTGSGDAVISYATGTSYYINDAAAGTAVTLNEGAPSTYAITYSGSNVTWGNSNPSTAYAGDTVSFTVSANSNYRITGVKYNDGSDHPLTASNGTYSFTMPSSDVTVTATTVRTYTVTLSASGTGMGSTKQYFVGTTPGTYSDYSSAVTVDAGSTVYFKVSYATGYEYNSVTNATVYTANTVFKTGAINANTTVTITASEKAKKTITVTNTSSGGTGTINVSGNSVSGEATSFAAGTSTFQAHVDDVLTFSPTPGSQSKLSSEGIKINGTAATTLTVTDAATVTATFVNDPSTILYIQKNTSGTQKLYTWSMKSTTADADTKYEPNGVWSGATISSITGVVTLKIDGKDYYKVTIANSAFGSTHFGAIVSNNGGDKSEFKGNLVGGTYKITGTSYTGMKIAAWSDSNYAVNLTETGGTLNTTHTAAATFQSNSTSSGTTIGTNPANYAGSTITVTAHPKSGYWAFVTATYGGSATTGLAETGSGLVSNIIKKIELAATGAGETAVTVTGSPIKSNNGTATFTMPAGATDVTVNYTAIPTYTMKLSAGAHGTIALKSGSTTLKTAAAGTTENVTVTAGTSYSVVVTPDSGYLVKTLSEAGTTVSAAAGQTSAYTHSWTAPDEQPGNTYLTGTFARNDPEISTLLYNGYDTSGNSVTGYVDKAFKTSTYNGETFAYYKVSGRGTGDHLFTVKNNAEETATGSAIYFTRPNHSYWSSSGVKAHFYTDGSGTIGNEFYEMDFSYNDDYGNAVYRLNLDSYSSLKSALTADTKVTFHNSASVATATGWGLMTWAGCFYCPNAGDNNNFSLAGWPSGQKSDAFNITTGRTYNGGDNGSGKAYQHNNDGYYGSDMSLNNHYTSGYDYEKTNSSSTSDYYILYFYPNTNYGTINNKSANNTNDYPIIVASTKLPNDEDDGKITVYAKYGTVDTGHSPTAEFGSTTVVTNADVEVASTNTTDGYVVAKATPGKSITLTTTVNSSNASKYYVKGWDINGTTYGLNPEATGNSYTLTYNIPEDAETLEITPIYWMKDSSKMTRFYVRSFNEAPAAWGDALYCYFYNSSTADIGYPGQPCVHEGALYYTEIPTDSQGITLNNAVWDTIHGEMMMGLSGTTEKQNAHYQTYDYDNFQKIVKEKSDGLKSIYFTFEFRDKKDNLGSTSGSSSSIKLSDYDDTNGNGWEDFKDLKGNFINIFDEELGSGQGQTSLDASKTLYVISNGYACNYEGEFATEWAVYVSTDGTNATYVTTIPSSALLINSAARLSESVYPNSNTAKYTPLLSSYTSAYNTLKNTYSHYKVKITYEKVLKYGDSVLHGNNIETNDIANRIDGKWDYTKNTDYVVADVKIQYRNTPDGAYTDDTFGGTGNYTGTTTQATAYFTNEEPVVSGATSIYQKTSCPTGTYYVSNDVYFTFLTTPKASAGYQFDGWYMKTDASDEAVLIDTSTSAKSLMDSNATFIARYTKVSSGSLTITHSSSGSGSANRIALKAEVIDPNDPTNAIETYSGTDYVTIPTAYIKNTSSYQVKVTLYSVANPATSYIDMVTNPTAITSEKDGGSVNVFNSPTYTYDRRDASKYNQNVTTVIGAFNISALFSGTTQNTMLINYTTRIDKLPTYTINYRYHGRGQTGDNYMTFTRTISLTPDEAEGKNADGTTYSGNNGQALTATYITSSSDNLVNDITANAPNQNDLQTEVFNKEIEWEAPNSIEPNSTTVTAIENAPKYTLTYTYVDGNDGIKYIKTVEAEYNELITLGEKIGETTTYATAETYDGKKFAYWALGNAYGDPLTSTREYKMRLVNDVTIYPVYGTRDSGWTAAIDKITRTHQTSDTSDSIFTDFALRFTGFDDNGSFIHINPDFEDKYTVGVAVVYDTAGNNTTETDVQKDTAFYNLSPYTDAKTMIQTLVDKNKTTARLREISDTTYVSKYDADNNKLTNFNRIDYALKYNYNTYYKRSYDAYAYIVDKDTNTVLAVSPVKSGYLYDGKLPSGAGN